MKRQAQATHTYSTGKLKAHTRLFPQYLQEHCLEVSFRNCRLCRPPVEKSKMNAAYFIDFYLIMIGETMQNISASLLHTPNASFAKRLFVKQDVIFVREVLTVAVRYYF